MRSIRLVIFLWLPLVTFGQVHEWGFFAGGNNYIGDIGDETYYTPDGWRISGYYRVNINEWYAVRIELGYGQLNVADHNAQNLGRRLRNWQAEMNVLDGSFLFEYNFAPLNPYKRPLKVIVTPYLATGVNVFRSVSRTGSLTTGEYIDNYEHSLAVPLHFGLKFSITRRLKINWDFGMNYCLTDDFEGSRFFDSEEKPLTNRTSNDWYLTSGIGISYGFGELPCYLNVF